MKINEYQTLAARTINYRLMPEECINHAVFGICSEAGEIAAHYQKVYQGHPIDKEKVKSEVGDLAWFIAEICTAYDWKLDDVLLENIDKLRKRYPDGFEAERSVHREVEQ